MIGLIGKKLGQTSVFDRQEHIVPVTIVSVGPNHVVQCRDAGKDGYRAVQLGFGEQKESRLSRPLAGHLRAHACPPLRVLREFRDYSLPAKPGDILGASVFEVGDFVDVVGITKGRGFEGVVKRHGFRGGDMTHGAKGWHRRPGAIGQRLFPGTVRRGLRLPGHMGCVRRTVQNLQVIEVRADDHILLIRGAIPGANGDYVIVRGSKKLPKGSPRAAARLAAYEGKSTDAASIKAQKK